MSKRGRPIISRTAREARIGEESRVGERVQEGDEGGFVSSFQIEIEVRKRRGRKRIRR